MSGHSKWSTIKHKKGALDKKRGKIFTKLIKEITVAAKEGGPDPELNPRLRLAVQNAKGKNMPKDTIERAIKKVAGGEAADYQELTYEGYAPHGVAVFVECTTDNLNRTVAAVRSIFTKNGGNLGTNGSLEFIFDRKGVFALTFPEGQDEDDLTLELIDGGAEDVEIDDGMMTLTCAMEDFGSMQKKLEELGLEAENAELERIPNSYSNLSDDDFSQVMKTIDALEDDDDVQKVFHNIEATDSQLESL
jgi:YebC/PmpR family DNA-binding regulatory protein